MKTWREYHEFTKHTVSTVRRAPPLDWANMPDPFRHYDGAPIVDLPVNSRDLETPALELLLGAYGGAAGGPALIFLSQLLFFSAAISAHKMVASTGTRYALRVNPSSGNLHPTEFHFLTNGLEQFADGLYHYCASSHWLERRATGRFELNASAGSAALVFILTSIVWREAWKYGNRAYRYCLHDIGHAWQAIALAARAMGCDCSAVGDFPDDEVAQLCRLSEDEWPMLILELRGNWVSAANPQAGEIEWYGGQPNPLSKERIIYTPIEEIHAVTKLHGGIGSAKPAVCGQGEIKLPPKASSSRPFGETARRRRSALDFEGGARSISLPQLSAILGAALQPLSSDFTPTRFVQLYLYVHRVDGLAPGVYKYWPELSELELILRGDQRFAASGLSLGQDLAGNACVAVSMIADIERSVCAFGDRGYRYVHFEAGAIGQRLYIAAEALGLGATGIGAFFDDAVHGYLNLTPEEGQVVYHFAIGYPIPDRRIEG